MDMIEDAVRRAAERGARRATNELQVVRDAADHALQQWRKKGLRTSSVADPAAWAFRVGRNAAKKLGKRIVRFATFDPAEIPDSLQAPTTRGACSPEEREIARRKIAANEKKFRGRQFAVAMKLTEPGMSLHRAAQELGMSRWNLKRAFQGALRRLSALDI